MKREYYSGSISNFLRSSTEEILGVLALNNFALIQTQRGAWVAQIEILCEILSSHQGSIYFEYSIPRMGRRIDVVLLIGPVIFVLEFKVGESEFSTYALDQVCDYALDLKNFHDSSHEQYIAPVLIATNAKDIGEWIDSINRSFHDWHIYISSRLTDSEYNAGKVLVDLRSRQHVTSRPPR